MARNLTSRVPGRLWARLWLLSAVATVITLTVGICGYFIAKTIQDERIMARMPPEVRAEIDVLVARGEYGSVRYFELYDRYWSDEAYIGDITMVVSISIVSILASGAVAAVLARTISQPISDVAQAAAKVASGNFSVRVPPNDATGEVADLIACFNALADDIEAYERERRVLNAGIAHELRTPLTILKGRLHAQIDGVIVNDGDEAARLLRQVEQLSRIVEDLRTLAHAEVGDLPLDLRQVDLAAIVTAVAADLQHQAHAAGICIETRTVPIACTADPVRLTQIVTNLVSNAVKHSAPEGTISLIVDRTGGCVAIEVCDEGPGFDEADIERMFIPFWRAAANQIAGRTGSGLGLALADELARLMGGKVTAHNRDDRSGARFVLALPLD